MKVKFYLAMTAAAFLMTNCSQDENLIQTKGSTNTLTAAIESASRSTVTDGGIFAWAVGDAIAVGNAEGSYTKFEYRNGTFTAQTAIVPTGYAIYPYNGAYTELPGGTTLPGITLPSEYDYGSTNAPMLATISGNNNQLTFNHLAGLMRFRVKGIPQGTTEFSLTADMSITGSFTPEADNEGKTCIKAGTGDTNKEVKITFTSVEDVMDFYVPMPVGEYTSLTVKIGDKELASTNGVTNTISRGKLLLMPTMVFENGDLKLEGGNNVSLNDEDEVDLEVSDGEEVVVEMIQGTTATLNLTAPASSTEGLTISDGSEEGTESGESVATLNVSADNISTLIINAPTLTVNLTSGEYEKVEALTATNTLVIGDGVTIKELVLNGGNVKLGGDLELTSPLVIKEGITTTFDLNGKTLSYTSATINEAMITNNGTLTIQNGTVTYNYTGEADATYSKGNYAINNSGTLTIDANINAVAGEVGKKFSHAFYAINTSGKTDIKSGKILNNTNNAIRQWVASETQSSDITVYGGEIEGLRAIWIQLPNSDTSKAPKANLTVKKGTLRGTAIDGTQDSGNVLAIYATSQGNQMKNVEINIEDGDFYGDLQLTGGRKGAKLDVEKVTITGGTFHAGNNAPYVYSVCSWADDALAAQSITITGGTFAHLYPLKYMEGDNGDINVTLGKDLKVGDTDEDDMGGPILIPSGNKVTLDLNGKTISQTSDTPVSMITNNGNLTIKDSSNGSGKIDFTFNGTVNNNVAANVISNRGTLVVEGGEISNAGTGNQIGYAIDNYNGSTLTVNGGKITASGSSYYDGIRLFCGSNETTVTVNKGEISTIWAQNPTTDKATEVKGTVIFNGGTVNTIYYENYTTVKVKTDVTATVTPYGTGQDNTTTITEGEYTVYSFVHSDTNE